MKANNELAAYMIIECLEENLFEPNQQWPDNSFEERSYARWAAYELAERIMDRPHEEPDDILHDFMVRMYFLSELTDDPKKKRIFSIAAETAEDILTLF